MYKIEEYYGWNGLELGWFKKTRLYQTRKTFDRGWALHTRRIDHYNMRFKFLGFEIDKKGQWSLVKSLENNLRKKMTLENHLDKVTNSGMWLTKKNKYILIENMENGHLANTIHMLVGHGFRDHPKLQELIAETRRRGWKNFDDIFLLSPEDDDFTLEGAL